MEKEFSLFIGQAFYECRAFSPQIPCLFDSLRALDMMGVRYHMEQVNGDSYVSRAKNALVHQFLKSDFSHLMIIDSDETWELSGFLRLIKAAMHPLFTSDVVAGLYPCKNNWQFYGGWPAHNEDGFLLGKEVDGIRVLEMQAVPGGFLIYSREAIERTRPFLDSYIAPETDERILEVFQDGIEFHLPRVTRDALEVMSKEDLIGAVLARQRGGREAGRIGEDIYFQRRYSEAGGKLWCQPDIQMGHIGTKEWVGNYHEHLMKCRGIEPCE